MSANVRNIWHPRVLDLNICHMFIIHIQKRGDSSVYFNALYKADFLFENVSVKMTAVKPHLPFYGVKAALIQN